MEISLSARHCAERFAHSISLNPHNSPVRYGSSYYPTLQMVKLRIRGVTQLLQPFTEPGSGRT